MTRSIILAIALASGVLAGTPAAAAPATPAVAKVYYGDLNLSSDAGSRTLERRIERALRRVCDFDPHQRQQALKKAATRCMTESRKQIALPQTVASRLARR